MFKRSIETYFHGLLTQEERARENPVPHWRRTIFHVFWEVLSGVGVDGVGEMSPLFLFFFRFSLILSEDKGKRLQFTAKMRNFVMP